MRNQKDIPVQKMFFKLISLDGLSSEFIEMDEFRQEIHTRLQPPLTDVGLVETVGEKNSLSFRRYEYLSQHQSEDYLFVTYREVQ